jgi:hypothetical protein
VKNDLEFKLSDCLSYDPFYGDETEIIVLKDKMLTTRKEHVCQECRDDISEGSLVRARSEINREEAKKMTFYWCLKCCLAMMIGSHDDGDYLSHRFSKLNGLKHLEEL